MKKFFIRTVLLGASLGWITGVSAHTGGRPATAAYAATDGGAPTARSTTERDAHTTGSTPKGDARTTGNTPEPEAPTARSTTEKGENRTAPFPGGTEAIPSAPDDSLGTAAPEGPLVTIRTNLGTMKLRLYADVPNHIRTFLARARSGAFNGTLFTRVIREFMIQGGAPDSKNAPAGARCGFGDASAEIPPELKPQYFHKRGALAAPRQNDDINPERKSDMSQFFIVQGKVYRQGELDTLERIQNQAIRKKALDLYYRPVRVEMQMLKHDNPREFNKRVAAINQKIDSMILATPGHLIFTPEQREAYTTTGGCHFLDGTYTVFGELVEGFEVLDAIAAQPKDRYDRPLKDVRILGVE